MDWSAGILGAVAGGAGEYNKIKDEQRKWNMQQATEDAAMERKLHFQDLSRKSQFAFDKENAGALDVAKQKRIDDYNVSPEAIAARQQLAAEKSELAGSEQEAINEANLQYQKDLTSFKVDEEKRLRKDQLGELFEAIDKSPSFTREQKDKMKWQARLSAFGYNVPDNTVEKIDPDIFRKARANAATEVKDWSDEMVEDWMVANKESFKSIGEARTFIADQLTWKYLPAARTEKGETPEPKGKLSDGTEVTPETVRQQIGQLPRGQQEAMLNRLKQEDPEMYREVTGAGKRRPPMVTIPEGSPIRKVGKTLYDSFNWLDQFVPRANK